MKPILLIFSNTKAVILPAALLAAEIYDPDNELIGRVNTINVPTKRGRNTTVRGRFLTSKATGDVGIGPDFDGDYNIEIKLLLSAKL